MDTDPDELAQAIDALDGISTTLVAGRADSWDLLVGGGPDRFVLTATRPGRVANALGNRTGAQDETIDLSVGDRVIAYPVRFVLTRQEITTALTDLGSRSLAAERWEV